MKKLSKMLAILLTITLLCTPVFATEKARLDATDDVANVISLQSESPVIVNEVVALREQSAKHFLLSDGNYTVAVYDTPIHYMEENEWIEIDNSLVSATLTGDPFTGEIKRDTELTATEKQTITSCEYNAIDSYHTEYYENSANNFKVQLPKEINDSTPIAISYGEHSLRFCLIAIEEAAAEIIQPPTEAARAQLLQQQLNTTTSEKSKVEIQNKHITTAYKNRSSVSYASVKNNIDLNYYICGQTLKEDFVLHSLPSEKSFTFNFSYIGLSAVLGEDNSVIFYDETNKPIFTLAAPFMFDANDEYCTNISVTLEETSTGCQYTLAPDREWLESSNRAFPVTMDPTIYSTQNTNYIYDNTVQQSDPNTNYVSVNRMYVGSGSGSTEGRIYFNLTQWPSATYLTSSSIISARLALSYYPQANWQTAYNTTINVYKLTSSWNTNTITWNNQTNIGGTLISSKYISDSRNKTSGYETFDITEWVAAHYSNPSTDYGIRLQPQTITSSTNRACFISSDYYDNTSLRPIIYIDYHNYVFGLVGITDPGHDHTSFMDNPIRSNYLKSVNTDTTPQETLNILRFSRAFISRSHGSRESIVCSGGSMTRADVLALPSGALSHMQLVYYGACSTGEGGENAANLVNATFDRGARTVIGFTGNVVCTSCNDWTDTFMDYIRRGYSIGYAMSRADDSMGGSPGGTGQRLVRGPDDVAVS